jgi:hypothetical protein
MYTPRLPGKHLAGDGLDHVKTASMRCDKEVEGEPSSVREYARTVVVACIAAGPGSVACDLVAAHHRCRDARKRSISPERKEITTVLGTGLSLTML